MIAWPVSPQGESKMRPIYHIKASSAFSWEGCRRKGRRRETAGFISSFLIKFAQAQFASWREN
jgi:hypothetical protein